MNQETTSALTVWLVAPGTDYEGEDANAACLFHTESAARAYEAELLFGVAVDYVVVRQVAVA